MSLSNQQVASLRSTIADKDKQIKEQEEAILELVNVLNTRTDGQFDKDLASLDHPAQDQNDENHDLNQDDPDYSHHSEGNDNFHELALRTPCHKVAEENESSDPDLLE